MKQRIITALWGLPILIAIIWFGDVWFGEPWLFTLLIAAAAILGIGEFYRLTARGGIEPLKFLGLVFALLFLANAYFDFPTLSLLAFDFPYTLPLLAAAIILPLIWLLFRPPREMAFINWAWTLAGILYVGWMLGYWVALRGLDQGKGWVFLALFSTFACDTGAFFVGRAWGKHPLTPTISPGKTWEGAIGGFLASPAATLIIYTILNLVHITLPLGYTGTILIGCLIGIFAQLGDLAESLLKRSVGVKDSGSLIPGHGGVLDRIDSVVFTGIIAYYYVIWLG